MHDVVAYVGLGSNVVLAIVTTIYVILTRRIAKASEESGRAAKVSAEAAKDSARSAAEAAISTAESAKTQQAALDAQVNALQPLMATGGGGEGWDEGRLEFALKSGGAYWIRRVELVDVSFRSPVTGQLQTVAIRRALEPADPSITFPTLLDETQNLLFRADVSSQRDAALGANAGVPAQWTLRVDVSVSESIGSARRVTVVSGRSWATH